MGGRKGAKREALDGELVEPQQGESIMRVLALRGSNQIEVEDEKGTRTLCRMPARFSKSMWIKRGSYVIVEEADRDKVLEANGKITGTLSRVLYSDQVRMLRKTSFWPAGFQAEPVEPVSQSLPCIKDEEVENSDDDDQPPLEQNLNRHGGDFQVSASEESEDDEL